MSTVPGRFGPRNLAMPPGTRVWVVGNRLVAAYDEHMQYQVVLTGWALQDAVEAVVEALWLQWIEEEFLDAEDSEEEDFFFRSTGGGA